MKLINKSNNELRRLLHLSSSINSKKPHRMSRVLLLDKTNFDNSISKSFSLLKERSFVASNLSGLHYLLPLATRSLTKLISIIDQEMEAIGGEKMILPTLGHSGLLKISGKLPDHQQDVFIFKDRHGQDLFLTPTHEEMFCYWLSKEKIFEKQLPIYLYQIASKYRDEARPRSGLLRGKEFMMKDLYSFDATEADSQNSYNRVCQSYQNIFDRLEINVIKVQADPGAIGGNHSHEYHLISDIGEDTIHLCSNCNQGFSEEYIEKQQSNQSKYCDSCNCDLQAKQSIEVGHAFYLATRYTQPFRCFYRSKTNNYSLLQMGSYGLGVTRILASCAEILSTPRQLKWPKQIAPFHVTVIPPKMNSKESNVNQLAEDLAQQLAKYTNADVVIDDRSELTIGYRQVVSKCLGIPVNIIVGKKAQQEIPLFELSYYRQNHRLDNDKVETIKKDLSLSEIMEEIKLLFPINDDN